MVYKVSGQDKWFFICRKHDKELISSRYDSEEEAQRILDSHNRIKH